MCAIVGIHPRKDFRHVEFDGLMGYSENLGNLIIGTTIGC